MVKPSEKTYISSVQKELSIRSEPIQRIYNFYISNLFLVNRRYQRKLVWTIEEKSAFIDSILKGFPVPIILLAQTEKDEFEIIDGMQRLNAIVSFVEGEFDFGGRYFDLETMVESKSRLDQSILVQKTPVLERGYCEAIASYILPISVYSFDDNERVDEVFRRINSNGKHLSRQELRAAGATARFPDLVRRLSSEIRTDTSASDVLLLSDMKVISITNRQLDYGIRVDDIFWVKNNILTKEMVRESQDEEVVADIVAFMVLSETPRSSSEVLDEYYGLKESSRKEDIESALQKRDSETIRFQFLRVYDEIRRILNESCIRFNELISERNLQKTPRYFQIIFLSLYDLMFRDRLEVADYEGLIESLRNIAQNINITTGGNWSAANKSRNINSVKGIIRTAFKPKETEDPATDSWLTEFETLLTQSKTEQNLYDFKQGFTTLDGKGAFDQESFNKIIKTLTAMANHSPDATGYVCVGVADNDNDALRVERIYNITPIEYKGFKITGIEHEANRLQGNIDGFFKWLVQRVQNQPVEQHIKDSISRNVRLVKYLDKMVILFKLKSGRDPMAYDNKFYQRLASNLDEVRFQDYADLFRRFSSKS